MGKRVGERRMMMRSGNREGNVVEWCTKVSDGESVTGIPLNPIHPVYFTVRNIKNWLLIPQPGAEVVLYMNHCRHDGTALFMQV